MKEYHKIHSIFKRDQETNRIVLGEYARDEFSYLANNEWVFTEKVDGTNIRVMLNHLAFGNSYSLTFGGKTDAASIPAQLLNRLRERFDPQIDLLAEMFPPGVCLYGEGYGAKIQKGGGNYRPDQDFVLFDVKVGDWWLNRNDVVNIAERLGLDAVPLMGAGKLSLAVDWAAQGFKSAWGNFEAEGVVARPKVELKARNGDRIITKIKCKDFAHLKQVVAV